MRTVQRGTRFVGSLLLALPVALANAACGESSAVGNDAAGMRQHQVDVKNTIQPGMNQENCQLTLVAVANGADVAYSKQTEFDNTPQRFNMVQNGRLMSADDFDLWLHINGYYIGRRVDASTLAQHIPQT